AKDLLKIFEAQKLDYTTTMRGLSSIARGEAPFAGLVADDAFEGWSTRWLARLDAEPDGRTAAAGRMDAVNPVYIPRNHLVESALDAAVGGDLGPTHDLLEAITGPFEARDGFGRFAEPAPDSFDDGFKTFCGT
ncbi:MAG: hypothetical protein KUG77_07575, partial [Nannocystaceae bacterium]|nr:hypothetical protein [Nannocystaceae bacterium]